MIIIVLGMKDEYKWSILRKQYIGHTVIEVGEAAFSNISDLKEYEQEFYKDQVNNFAKKSEMSTIFVTYNTIIDLKYASDKDDTIFICNKLKDTFAPLATQSYRALNSFEMISDFNIEFDNNIINVFRPDQTHIINKIMQILTHSKVQFHSNFDMNTNSEDILYFIPSILYPYSTSVYSPEDRLRQTIKQLKSIKNYDPIHSKSIIMEMSDINYLSFSKLFELAEYADKVIIFGDDKRFLDIASNQNKNKGEIELLRSVLPKFSQKEFSHFYKFGARYYLHDEYKDLFNSNYDLIMKKIPSYANAYKQDIIEPVLYCVNKKAIVPFIQQINMMSIALITKFLDVERMLMETANRGEFNTLFIDRLNVSGNSAVTGIFKTI